MMRFHTCCSSGDVCRDSDRSGPIKLLRAETEEALLQTRVKTNEPTSKHFSYFSVICPKFAVSSLTFWDFLHVPVSSGSTKWFSTPSRSGWRTSGRISCPASWEVSDPCTQSFSCVSCFCFLQTFLQLLSIIAWIVVHTSSLLHPVQSTEWGICSGCL